MRGFDALAVWRADRWVRPFFRRYRRALAVALLCGVGALAFAVGLMASAGHLAGAAVALGSVLLANLPLGLVRLFGVGKPILHYLERLASHDWVLRMTSGLRRRLYAALEKDAPFFRATHRMGDALGLLADDVGHIQNLYLRTVFPLAVAWTAYALAVALLGLFSPGFALAMLLLLGVTVFLLPLAAVLANGARVMRRRQLRGQLYAQLTDDVLGVADWVFSQRGSEYLARHRDAQEAVRQVEEALDRSARRRDFAMQVLCGAAAVLVIAWAGLRFGGGQTDASANWIIALSLAFFPLADAFAPLPEAAVGGLAHLESVRRLNGLDGGGGACSGAGAPLSDVAGGGKGHARSVADCAGRPAPAAPLDIRFEGASFRYADAPREVLRRIDLQVPFGQKVAVLGRSGAGKSTLVSLIRGDVSPTAGAVTVGGSSASTLGDAAARLIGVIQQQTYLFNATLLDNLRIGNPDATEDQALAALAQVGLSGLVERLPQGLCTLVDEGGLRFSGGERHRIALARVLLQDAPLVILDEPFAGLDPVTERTLLDAVLRVTRNRTLVMVTHHLQGVSRMDRVLFVEDGSIALDGAPAALEESSERYRRLLAFDRGSEG